MNSVEQIQNSVADDGLTVPQESGSTGEIGSDAESREDARREWEELISSPKYHALYTEHISDIVRKRLKSERESRTLLDAAAKLLGLDGPEGVPDAIERLVTPALRDWQSEEAAVKEKYPEFDLSRGMQDPAFAGLLQGFVSHPEVSLTQLYELFSLDSLTKAAAEQAAARTASHLLGAVQQRHERPHENGLHKTALQNAGKASHLTRTQRAVLAERAAKGERITF